MPYTLHTMPKSAFDTARAQVAESDRQDAANREAARWEAARREAPRRAPGPLEYAWVVRICQEY